MSGNLMGLVCVHPEMHRIWTDIVTKRSELAVQEGRVSGLEKLSQRAQMLMDGQLELALLDEDGEVIWETTVLPEHWWPREQPRPQVPGQPEFMLLGQSPLPRQLMS